MIRKLLATTAVATLIATGAVAQTTLPAPAPADPALTQPAAPMVIRAEGHLASSLIGATVYNGAGDDAQNIGKVNDLVIGPDGEVEAVVIGVGGFLGLGRKDVAIEYDLVQWAERDGNRWLVVETTEDALKAQAEFDRAAYQPMPADADVAETKPATREDLAMAPAAGEAAPAATTEAPEAGGSGVAVAPVVPSADGTDDTATAAIGRDGLQPLAVDQIRVEEFVGTTVYGANDERIGEIGDVALSTDGKVDAVILDVGGFLGIGEKEVAIGMDNLGFMTDADGNRYLYTPFTKEQLEAAAEYRKGDYAARRDEMRLVVPN